MLQRIASEVRSFVWSIRSRVRPRRWPPFRAAPIPPEQPRLHFDGGDALHRDDAPHLFASTWEQGEHGPVAGSERMYIDGADAALTFDGADSLSLRAITGTIGPDARVSVRRWADRKYRGMRMTRNPRTGKVSVFWGRR